MTKQLEVNPKTETLIKARDIIERGWCQGVARQGSGNGYLYCITGSIWEAVSGFNFNSPEDQALMRLITEEIYAVIGRVLPGSYRGPASIVEWNDWPFRRKEEVLELMNRAIAVSISDGINARSEAT